MREFLDPHLAQIEVAMKGTKEWFETWFDTNEYHALYGHRDSKEADDFVKKLIDRFQLQPCNVLDAGCGAGRHVHSWATSALRFSN